MKARRQRFACLHNPQLHAVINVVEHGVGTIGKIHRRAVLHVRLNGVKVVRNLVDPYAIVRAELLRQVKTDKG